jgi:uncharacterized membrane protein
MKISNPLKMNDWEITKFLRAIFVIQVAVLGIIILDGLGWYIPILRQIIPVVYLLFVPGILILRVIRVHNIGSVEVFLYSVGLSITCIMFIGFFINLIYPLLRIFNPISLWPLIITFSIFVVVLSFLCYWRDKDYSNPDFIDSEDLLSPYVLFLFLIPFLAIFGTYLMNLYKNNILISVLFIIISLIVILFAYNKISRKFYPLTIFIISISLLFQTSLISNYITGFDIQSEYYLTSLVIKNGFWNLTFNVDYNNMLSDTMLAPILSIISEIDLDWIFKIVYPLLFSLVPLGLYIVFKKQTSEKIAFLSSFFFMSFYVFYTEMLGLARQEIAEIFLVLLLLVMITRNLSNITRSFFLIIFGISLIVSHYGIAYIYMFSLLIVYLIILLNDHYNIKTRINFISRYDKTAATYNEVSKNKILSFTFVLFFIIFTLSYYMYTSSEKSLIVFLNLLSIFVGSITTQFFNPASVQGLAIIQEPLTPLHILFRYGDYLIEFFTIIGVFSIFLRDRIKFRREYLAFILVFGLVQIGSVTLPFFSSALNTERLYQITLILLAPACVIGGLTSLDVIYGILKSFKIQIKNFNDKKIKILSIFFIIFLLFSSGFVFYWTNESSNYISFNSTPDTAIYNGMEVQSANWLTVHGVGFSEYGQNSQSGIVIADEDEVPLLLKYGINSTSFSEYYNSNFNIMNYQIESYNPTKNNFYFFFGTNNILSNTFLLFNYTSVQANLFNVTYGNKNNFNTLNKIYDSDGSQIYYES